MSFHYFAFEIYNFDGKYYHYETGKERTTEKRDNSTGLFDGCKTSEFETYNKATNIRVRHAIKNGETKMSIIRYVLVPFFLCLATYFFINEMVPIIKAKDKKKFIASYLKSFKSVVDLTVALGPMVLAILWYL